MLSNLNFTASDEKTSVYTGEGSLDDRSWEEIFASIGERGFFLLDKILLPEISVRIAVELTTKKNFYTYEGGILRYMSALDLSCNRFTGDNCSSTVHKSALATQVVLLHWRMHQHLLLFFGHKLSQVVQIQKVIGSYHERVGCFHERVGSSRIPNQWLLTTCLAICLWEVFCRNVWFLLLSLSVLTWLVLVLVLVSVFVCFFVMS